jgi:bifunctional non-homologous end joining protein LigD
MSNEERNITLYSQQGGSDKVYQLMLHPVVGGFGLTYANGRRGAALKPKPKTTKPLTYDQALKEFNKIINSKKKSSSRYAESLDNGDTLELSDKASQDSGIRVQLLNEITKDEALRLCANPLWFAQEKHDGERRVIEVKAGVINGTNRYGEYTGGLKSLVKAGIDNSIDMVVDTEDLGGALAAFDLLEYNGIDLRHLSFETRFCKLQSAIAGSSSIELSPVAITTSEKLAMLKRMITENREGMVFKLANAPYESGRPSKGGSQLKFKLYDEASFIVQKVNVQRSVQMGVLDTSGNIVLVGNVTIPANTHIPSVGDTIEVRYLYAYEGGSIYQPIFEKHRPDLRAEECVQSQLKYKRKVA